MKIIGIDEWTLSKARKISHRDIEVMTDRPNQVVSIITGTRPYRVELERQNNVIYGNCTCPAYFNDFSCKHIGALWLNLPITFYKSSDPSITYILHTLNDEWDDDYDDKELIYGSYSQRKNTIADDLQDLETTIKSYKADTLESFYAPSPISHSYKPQEEIVYELSFERGLSIEFKKRQLLKNGIYGKVKAANLNFSSLEKIDSFLRPFLTTDYYSNKFFKAYIPAKDVPRILPDILKTNRAVNHRNKTLQWLDARLRLQLVIDSKEKNFQVKLSFTDGIIRHGIHYNIEHAYGYSDDSCFFLENFIPSGIFDLFSSLANKNMSIEEWDKFKNLMLRDYSNLIAGDFFDLPVKKYSPVLCFHFKYQDPENIEGFLSKESSIAKDCILVEDQDFLNKTLNGLKEIFSTPVEIDKSFSLDHSQLVLLMEFFNAQGIEIKSYNKKVHQLKNYHFKIKSQINWFETSLEANVQDNEFDLVTILKALKSKSHFLTLKNGDEVLLPQELTSKLNRLAEYSNLKNGKLLTHQTRSVLLDEWAQSEFTADSQFIAFREKLKSFKNITASAPQKSFKAKLREYQRLGLGWMEFLQDMGMGGCLADDMGLGKTIQVLSHLHKRVKVSKSTSPSLIVCPKSLVFNWRNEAEKFTPNLKVEIFSGGPWDENKLNCDVLIMSYSLVLRNIEVLKDVNFDYVVLDEAQYIKNPSGLSTKACQLLSANYRLALTGTPIENHAGDLMSIFNFLIPGCFGSALTKGRILKQDDLNFLRPFILRRTKEEVLKELPPKSVQVIYCEQTDTEKKYYDQLRRIALGELGTQENKIHILSILTRMRQASCHPGLIDKKLQKIDNGKLKVLKQMVDEIIDSGNKILIFSQFTELLKLTRSYLEMDDSNSSYLDGQTRKREEFVNEFKTDSSKKCFFISLKAGGTGLNLTEANYCFILDPWWNPAVENQAIDRIHRIGQINPVNAYRLITKNTIEEKVLELQGIKTELASGYLDGNEDFIRNLSPKDLQFLFS
jgi:SNF2 family DNA or RNA helicase